MAQRPVLCLIGLSALRRWNFIQPLSLWAIKMQPINLKHRQLRQKIVSNVNIAVLAA
jgi:hypothetical protein